MEASRAAVPAARPSAAPRLKLRPAADRAFEKLYERHARDVYQYALALLTNPADAEDVTQTTFLNAYRALQRGDRPQRPHNWLIAIAHNVCRMRWRQASHRPREVALEDAPEPVALEHDQPSIDDVLRALSRLSFNQRAALVMRELEGRSCKEIAQTLGLSVSAVEALLFRARRRLRIERRALGVLGTAPFPGSLASALGLGGGGGGGAVAGGATAIGIDAVLKAATILAVSMAVAAGTIAVTQHTQTPRPASRTNTPVAHRQQAAGKLDQPTHAKRVRHRARPARTIPENRATAREASGTTATAPPPVQVPPLPVQLPHLPVPPPPVELPHVQLPPLPVGLPPLPPLPPPPPVPPL
jgi:RNA polymerase sigma-70 factor (ECF subfamily)